MATVEYTFVETGSDQGFVDLNTGNMTVYYGTLTTPQYILDYSNGSNDVTFTETARQSSDKNFELWGVSPGAIVTGARLISATTTGASVNISGQSVRFIIRSAGGDIDLGSFDFVENDVIDNSGGSVVPTSQASSANTRFEVFAQMFGDGETSAVRMDIHTVIVEFTFSDTVITASESGLGSETKAVNASISKAESGLGTSAVSVLAQISAAETGLGSQSVAANGLISASESGLGSESTGVSVGGNASESGLGTETRSVMASISAAETGLGSESQSAVVAVSATESGLGSEFGSMAPLNLGVAESGFGQENTFVFFDESVVGFGERIIPQESFAVVSSISFNETWGAVESSASGLSFGETGLGTERQSVYDLTNPSEISDKTFAVIENPATFAVINQTRSFA